MARPMIAAVAGTFDTKAAELNYIAELIRAAGVEARTIDLGASGVAAETDVTAEEVAAAHPEGAGAVLGHTDRGAAVTAMAAAFKTYVERADWIGGLIGAGGSGGAALLSPAMQALPVGVPKVLVTTVASGNVAPYMGASDIAITYAVTDVQGLNRISRRVLGNAAHAMAGMLAHAGALSEGQDRPAIGLTMFGVTTACVSHIAGALEGAYDPLVFHATGAGGRSMEKLVDSGMIAAVIDLTTTELADLLVGGVFAATEDRMGAVIRAGVPYIGSCGALDMVNFGARETVPARFDDRLFHIHNPQVTLMRTTPSENAELGRMLAARLNQMTGPVRFLIPEGGVSAIDAPGMPFHDPEADAALFAALEAEMAQTETRRLIRIPHNINTTEFAEAALAQFREIA